jgi:hypothetical protein
MVVLSSAAQTEVDKPFGSKIIVRSGIGFNILKKSNHVIVLSKGLRIDEDSTRYNIRWKTDDNNFLILGRISNGDTISKQRFEFEFISPPYPKIRFNCQKNIEYSSRTINSTIPKIVLHRDSLYQLKNFYLYPSRFYSTLEFELIDINIHSGNTPTNMSIEDNQWELSDEFISSLSNASDTAFLSMAVTVKGRDGIIRKIGGGFELIQLDGEDYDRHVDRLYDYKRIRLSCDTVCITPKMLKQNDTLHFSRSTPFHIGLPRLKTDYSFKIERELKNGDEVYGWEPPYISVRSGQGYVYDFQYNIERTKILYMRSDGDVRKVYIVYESNYRKN